MSAQVKVLSDSTQRVRGTRNREREIVVAGPSGIERSVVKAQLLEGNTDVLSKSVKRKTSDKCLHRIIRLRIESMMMQTVDHKVWIRKPCNRPRCSLICETHLLWSEVTPGRIVQVSCPSRRK